MDEATTARFWSKVDQSGACWLWTGATTHGYGVARVDGRNVGAHRVSYELAHGPIPQDMQVDHVCHNNDLGCVVAAQCQHRACVRPDHLRLATNRDNTIAGRVREIHRRRFAAMTTCVRGHALSGENIRLTKEGFRQCRLCERVRNGAAGPPRRISDLEIATMRERLGSGETQKSVQEAMGLATNAIWRLRREGRL